MDERIIEMLEEADYSVEEIVAVLCACEYYDFSEEDVESAIENGNIETVDGYAYGRGTCVSVGNMEFAAS